MNQHNDPWETPESPTYGGHDVDSEYGEYDITPPRGSLNPWLSVWLRPRETYDYVRAHVPVQTLFFIAAISGIFEVLDRASMRNTGEDFELGSLIAIALIAGPISGVIGLLLGSFLISVTGRWIGGTGDFSDVRHAVGWVSTMAIVVGLLWIPQLLLFGHEMFTEDMPTLERQPTLGIVLLLTGLLELTGGIWTLVCALKMIGQAHDFSAWKALAASILAGLLLIVPIVIVAVVVGIILQA